MSGFDNARLDEEFFGAGRECEGCEQEFFPAGHVKSNFLCNLGYGDASKLIIPTELGSGDGETVVNPANLALRR